MSKPLTINLYNFSGATVYNISFGGETIDTTTNAVSNMTTATIILQPGTPSTPIIKKSDPAVSYQSYYLQMSYTTPSGTSVVQSVPISIDAEKVDVYFVNDNGIDYLALAPNGGDISSFTYSAGYRKSTALIAYKEQYAPASSYAFPAKSIVIAVANNKDITKLTKVTEIDWVQESSSYWWILILIAVVVIILIVVAVIVVVAKKKSAKKDAIGVPMYTDVMTTPIFV